MGPHQKDLDKSIPYPRSPSMGPSPCPRSLNRLHMLRKSNAPRSKMVILCPKAFAKWEAFM